VLGRQAATPEQEGASRWRFQVTGLPQQGLQLVLAGRAATGQATNVQTRQGLLRHGGLGLWEEALAEEELERGMGHELAKG